MVLIVSRIKLSFLAFGAVFAFCSLSYAANYQCGYEPQGCDQNPDCSAVMQQCSGPYNGQYLCPINQTACNPSHVCPSGGFYNDSVGKCQLNPSISCPSGGSYNFSTGECQTSPSISCPSTGYEGWGLVGVYDSSTGVCAVYNNNTGFWYMPFRGF